MSVFLYLSVCVYLSLSSQLSCVCLSLSVCLSVSHTHPVCLSICLLLSSLLLTCDFQTTFHCFISVWPKYLKLIGHRSKVTCLLYPNGEHDRYAPEHLVSGSADFTVKLWNVFTGALLTSFSVNGGEILRLTCTPPECNVSRLLKLVYS